MTKREVRRQQARARRRKWQAEWMREFRYMITGSEKPARGLFFELGRKVQIERMQNPSLASEIERAFAEVEKAAKDVFRHSLEPSKKHLLVHIVSSLELDEEVNPPQRIKVPQTVS